MGRFQVRNAVDASPDRSGGKLKSGTKIPGVNVPGLDNLQPPDVSAVSEVKAMEEPMRWVSKVEAAEELEVSLSPWTG